MLQKIKNTAKTVVCCQQGFFHNVFEQRPYVLVFKTTNWCWNNCPHCCESSNANNPRVFVPEFYINNIIDEAVTDKNFSRAVIFTGGEIMSAYKLAEENYVPNIINHALDAGCGVDVKTNAGWVNFAFADQIFNDIENIVKKRADKDDMGIKHLVNFQISLSLDRFHKDALDRNFKFIKHFANTNISGVAFYIHVSSYNKDRYMFSSLVEQLKKAGIEVKQLVSMNPKTNVIKTMYDLNGNVVMNYSEGTLFNGGRAKNIRYAYKTPSPQFVFMDNNFESLVAFDSYGNVTLGENSGQKISTPWQTEKADTKPLATIKSELTAGIKQAEQDFLNEHKALNWCVKQIGKIPAK